MGLKQILQAVVGLKTIAIDVSSVRTLAAATDYAAEDVMSNSATAGEAFVFNNMARKNGGSGTIEKAIAFLSTTALTPRITLYLFRDPPATNLNDNTANTAPSITDYPNCIGWIDWLAMEDLGGASSSLVVSGGYGNLPLTYTCNSRSLFGKAVTRDAITGESAGMILGFLLSVVQD